MNLVRLGHYHVPTGRDDSGYCQTALVVGVDTVPSEQEPFTDETVNLVVWTSIGDPDRRLGVHVGPPEGTKATFHLSGECPWQR